MSPMLAIFSMSFDPRFEAVPKETSARFTGTRSCAHGMAGMATALQTLIATTKAGSANNSFKNLS